MFTITKAMVRKIEISILGYSSKHFVFLAVGI